MSEKGEKKHKEKVSKTDRVGPKVTKAKNVEKPEYTLHIDSQAKNKRLDSCKTIPKEPDCKESRSYNLQHFTTTTKRVAFAKSWVGYLKIHAKRAYDTTRTQPQNQH